MNNILLTAFCLLACVAQAASAAGDMFDSGATGDVTAQMNQMWATFEVA
ncbi:MAG: hypothetical protein HN919_07090 [Verrucomicrobia bacterium]|jgi:hypothetical protein|nr:hypothetical protein [Verrucomicrobiota bacterium]MBT7066050.1 hypothetical protein [Verrucomicrobiota bacterium]MBT7702249.1 hypothetical protein [Verrucomicrobiota bacterium]